MIYIIEKILILNNIIEKNRYLPLDVYLCELIIPINIQCITRAFRISTPNCQSRGSLAILAWNKCSSSSMKSYLKVCTIICFINKLFI